MEQIRADESGTTYQADGFRVYYRVAGSKSGDNDVNVREHVYLLQGRMKVTVGDDKQEYEAPMMFEVPAKTYHVFESQSDTCFLVLHPDEE